MSRGGSHGDSRGRALQRPSSCKQLIPPCRALRPERPGQSEDGKRGRAGSTAALQGCEVLGFHSERGEKFLEGLREKGQDLTDLIGFLRLQLWGGLVGEAWELGD